METNMKTLSFIIFLTFLLLPVTSQGAPLESSVDPSTVDVRAGEFFSVNLTVKNNDAELQDVAVAVRGDREWWWQPGKLKFPLGSLEQETLEQGVFPVTGADPGVYRMVFLTTFVETPQLNSSSLLEITIIPDVFLKSISVAREGDAIQVSTVVDSVDERLITVGFVIENSGGNVVTSHSATEAVFPGESTITQSISLLPLQSFPPGWYTVRVTFGEDVLVTEFFMEAIQRFETSTVTTSNPFTGKTVTTVKNVGNTGVEYEFESVSPSGFSTTANIVATEVIAAPEEDISVFRLFLHPGETRTVEVVLDRLYVIGYLAAVIVVIAFLGIMTAGRTTNPQLRKQYRKRGKTTSVVLGVKNAYRETKNVIIRDWVSPLATVVMGEFESVRPIVRKSDAGTEMIWSLGNMKPKEERLISYKIKPIVYGNLKMSRASLKYKEGKKTRKILSNPIAIR